MSIVPSEYSIYNWLRKKGVNIRVLTADKLPVNYLVIAGNKAYRLIFKTIDHNSRIHVPEMVFGENIYLFVADLSIERYFLIPSFYCIYFLNKKQDLYLNQIQKKKFSFYPLEVFCEHILMLSKPVYRGLSRRAIVLDPTQASLQEFY